MSQSYRIAAQIQHRVSSNEISSIGAVGCAASCILSCVQVLSFASLPTRECAYSQCSLFACQWPGLVATQRTCEPVTIGVQQKQRHKNAPQFGWMVCGGYVNVSFALRMARGE